eukprot:gnl/TRDRNA2_/TRDRNA2_165149_c0_seq2.p1 gnl/TRDRNA2_/TRDRNA2_165149_c0~~gnl/TRDRNA2_/TRDRNA2_165149_c0_seq2.p1  ORF type:complete len:340 (-),score=71.61 gnl/TRDRNA2_/TRDRNA2_165149_c0_seq2:83-970(-)
MADMDENSTEQDIVSDTIAILVTLPMTAANKWPRRKRVEHILGELSQKYVNAADLMPAGFPTLESAEAYFEFYGRFEFLRHEEEEASGLEHLATSIALTAHKVENLDKKTTIRLQMLREDLNKDFQELANLESSNAGRASARSKTPAVPPLAMQPVNGASSGSSAAPRPPLPVADMQGSRLTAIPQLPGLSPRDHISSEPAPVLPQITPQVRNEFAGSAAALNAQVAQAEVALSKVQREKEELLQQMSKERTQWEKMLQQAAVERDSMAKQAAAERASLEGLLADFKAALANQNR